ncbi:MAG TPA: hypothetical protein VGQ76_11010 [Thermoanaerobaculia bacterium]|nr:hypothetical protein [Thermoanaerobaculia bacterium]
MRVRIGTALLLFAMAAAPNANAEEISRDATREKLRATLTAAGKRDDVNVTFTQSEKEPYNFIAVMEDFPNSDSLEIVIRVTPNDTLAFRVYPHFKGKYINLDSAKDAKGLMRTMLLFSDHNFLFWGVDDSKDAFAGYTITLDSGFPEEAVETVLRSIRNTDQFVGKMRPFLDGSAAPASN